ncbi:hypothetical protein MKEN_00228900 [Mycena kentingensis (nom. inval.)]|nr:hypothetical protein MKEN_00228900 [Mycena kentingensis (nom. inval.)]
MTDTPPLDQLRMWPRLTEGSHFSVLAVPLAALLSPYLQSGFSALFAVGVVAAIRALMQWLVTKTGLNFSVTAEIQQGDPVYDWVLLLLTQEEVWKGPRDFTVTAASLHSAHVVELDPRREVRDPASYCPKYGVPQIFRWKGIWIVFVHESSRDAGGGVSAAREKSRIVLTLYSRYVSALSEFVQDAHSRYLEASKQDIIVHLAEPAHWGPWVCSVVLPQGALNELLDDLQEFLKSADWYRNAGIPYRRGYLLYGPPGTGKTSTVHVVAGALGLEIYSLSLAADFVDDAYLQRAVAAIPKKSIFLLEDIDCAFPSREEWHRAQKAQPHGELSLRSPATLAGVLNVLDGMSSEEGMIFFATTNHVNRLDPALIRPGRIDHRVLFELATANQAKGLFVRLYSHERFRDVSPSLDVLASRFSSWIPSGQLSTAEIQLYLLLHKNDPQAAADGAALYFGAQLARQMEQGHTQPSQRDGS